jgi:hypothetical protein
MLTMCDVNNEIQKSDCPGNMMCVDVLRETQIKDLTGMLALVPDYFVTVALGGNNRPPSPLPLSVLC